MTDIDDGANVTIRERIMSIESVNLLMDEELDPMQTKRDGSWFSSYFNLTNTIVGAGILGLPYAYSNAGWVVGSIFLVASATFSFTGMTLLSFCAAKTGFPSTFYSVTRQMHKHMPTFVDILILMQLFGAAVAYLIIVGDLMPQACAAFNAASFWTNRTTWIVTAFLAVFPLSIPHNIDFLKYTSGASIIFLIIMIISLIVYGLPNDGYNPCEDQNLNDDTSPCQGKSIIAGNGISITKTLEVMSMFIFSYCCQVSTFPIFNELENGSIKKFQSVTFVSLFSSTVMYAFGAGFGYYTYGDSIKSDLLLNYPVESIMTVARMMIAFVVTFSYPLQINPARRSAMTILHNYLDDGHEPSIHTTRIRYFGFTLFFLIISLILSLLLEDLGIVVKVIGATGGVLVMFILPGYCYLFHFPLDENNVNNGDNDNDIHTGLLADDDNSLYSSSNSNSNSNGHTNLKLQLNTCPKGSTSAQQEQEQEDNKQLQLNNNNNNNKYPHHLNHDLLNVKLSRLPPCDDSCINDLKSLGLEYQMDIPKVSLFWYKMAWVQLVLGLILVPLSLIMIFVDSGSD
jgi:amino acid permease